MASGWRKWAGKAQLVAYETAAVGVNESTSCRRVNQRVTRGLKSFPVRTHSSGDGPKKFAGPAGNGLALRNSHREPDWAAFSGRVSVQEEEHEFEQGLHQIL